MTFPYLRNKKEKKENNMNDVNEFKYVMRFFDVWDERAIAKIETNTKPIVPQIGSEVWLEGSLLCDYVEDWEKYVDQPFEVREVSYFYDKDCTYVDVTMRGISL